ncbi:hypothetical protein LINPERPRIM_LOCUS36686, partial [Linum perenne]
LPAAVDCPLPDGSLPAAADLSLPDAPRRITTRCGPRRITTRRVRRVPARRSMPVLPDEPPVPWTRPDLPLTRSQVKAFKTRVTAYIGDWSRAKHEELDQRFIREGCTVLTLDDRQKINNGGKCPKDTTPAPADAANQPLPRLTLLHTQNLADKLKPEGSEGQKTWREPHLSEEMSSRRPEQPDITKTLAPCPERMMLGRSSGPKDVTRPPGHPEPTEITRMPPCAFRALFLAASGFLPAPGGFPNPIQTRKAGFALISPD